MSGRLSKHKYAPVLRECYAAHVESSTPITLTGLYRETAYYVLHTTKIYLGGGSTLGRMGAAALAAQLREADPSLSVQASIAEANAATEGQRRLAAESGIAARGGNTLGRTGAGALATELREADPSLSFQASIA